MNPYKWSDVILQSRFVHPELPPLPGATPAFCSKQLCWLHMTPVGPGSLAASGTALTLWGSRWRYECCCGFSDWHIPASRWVAVPSPPPCLLAKLFPAPAKPHLLRQHQHCPSGHRMLIGEVCDTAQTLRNVSCSCPVSSQLSTRGSRNDISEAAHLDKPFRSHCPQQDISVLQFLNPLLDVNKQARAEG